MTHSIEPATSGRAKCRGCGLRIAKGELRLGEALPNPFASEGDMLLWFHLRCGAFKRPEVLIETITTTEVEVEDRQKLLAEAEATLAHRRLPRAHQVQKSPSGRARCKSCRELIDKGDWRISLLFYEEGVFNPSGFVHVRCAKDYLGTSDILERLRHFTPELSPEDLSAIESLLS